MKSFEFLFIIFLTTNIINMAQQDTVIYNEETGNYIIQYLNEDDSLIIQSFIPWNKINPIVNCKAIFNNVNNEYLYSWRIKNGQESEQHLINFIIDYRDSIFTNLTNNGWHHKRWYQDNGIDLMNRVSWVGDQGLAPSWEVDGFVITSYGIPTIGNAYFQGAGGSILSYYDSLPPEKILKQVDKIDGFPRGYICRKTVVPQKIPEPLILVEFLDSLCLYPDISYSLSWISSERTKNKYNSYLRNAKTALEQNDTNSARIYLQNIVADVDIDSSTKLTSEAYALLKFNTEYILNQLPETNIGDMFDILINHIKKCYEKKWIDNKGIYNSLTKKVENAKKQYEKGKNKTSKNKLNAFNNQLNAQNGKHLNEACYNLLVKYSNFIMEKLQ